MFAVKPFLKESNESEWNILYVIKYRRCFNVWLLWLSTVDTNLTIRMLFFKMRMDILAVRRRYGNDCETIFPLNGNDFTERTVLRLISSMHSYRTRLLDRFIHKYCA